MINSSMKIFEILDHEEPVDEFDAAEREEEQSELDGEEPEAGIVKKAFRGAMHGYKKLRKKSEQNSVSSTWIAALDYDHSSQNCTMRLSDGRNYDIVLPPSKYDDWVKAPSKGKYFHRHVKGIHI